MKKVAVLGAGGKMGYRVSANLRGAPYQVSHIEVSEAGRNRLKELGITCVDADSALPQADVVILAIPDNMIEKVTGQTGRQVQAGRNADRARCGRTVRRPSARTRGSDDLRRAPLPSAHFQ